MGGLISFYLLGRGGQQNGNLWWVGSFTKGTPDNMFDPPRAKEKCMFPSQFIVNKDENVENFLLRMKIIPAPFLEQRNISKEGNSSLADFFQLINFDRTLIRLRPID